MCTHQKYVTNPYTGKRLLTKCGCCPACLQEKSDRAYSKVRAHSLDKDYFTVFVTLNYSNEFVPFVIGDNNEPNDLFSSSSMPVYRLNKIRTVRVKTKRGYTYRPVVKNEHYKICDLEFSKRLDKNFDINDFLCGSFKPVEFPYIGNCTAVCISKDFSDFLKRFRQNYARHFEELSEPLQFSYYRVSEYGPSTFRPHFHALLHFPRRFEKYYNYIRRTIIKSWPFCSYSQISKNIGIARNASAYVTSYTSRPTDLPSFYKISKIRPRSSHSRGYGFGCTDFSPSEILKKVNSGDLSYSVMSVTSDKTPIRLSLPIPQYVINRYFPKFKGFRLLSDNEIFSYLSKPTNNYYASKIGLTPEDVHKYLNSVYRCSRCLGLSYHDYAYFYQLFYRNYRRFNLINLYSEIFTENDCLSFYTNIKDISYSLYPPMDIDWLMTGNLNPNNISSIVLRSRDKEIKYIKKIKKAKFNDYVLSLDKSLLTQKINYGKFKKTS